MEIKSSKTILLILIVFELLVYKTANSQCYFDHVLYKDISINEFALNFPLKEIEDYFGSPERYQKYSVEDGEDEDGYEEFYYYFFKEFEITFVKYYGVVRLSTFNLLNKDYKVQIGKLSLKIGDSLNTLKGSFPNSYKCFYDENKYDSEFKKDKNYSFYIYIEQSESFIELQIQNHVINAIRVNLDPA